MAKAATASPKWRRRKEDRPAEIIAAAYAVFAEKGFASAKLEDIAQRAGVSKGALYLYFENKEDIFEAVVRQAIAPNLDMIENMTTAYSGPIEPLLRMMVMRMSSAIGFHFGPVIKMVVGESGNFPKLAKIWHDQMVDRGLGILSGLIARAQERGEVRPGDPRNYAATIISPVLASVLYRETFVPVGAKPFDIPALLQQHLDTILPGLLVKAA
jgi:AcrR family transcriptional regulator